MADDGAGRTGPLRRRIGRGVVIDVDFGTGKRRAEIGDNLGIVFNWDMRLKPDDSGLTDSLGLPVGPNDPFTASWQQVPASLNPVYQQQTAPKPGDRR